MSAEAQVAAARPTPRERTPRALQIIGAARGLLEAVGPDGLTMRRLADELGIRAPSLYKHVSGKPDLELGLVELAMEESGETLHRAVARGSADPVGALLTAYRSMGLTTHHVDRAYRRDDGEDGSVHADQVTDTERHPGRRRGDQELTAGRPQPPPTGEERQGRPDDQ